MDLAKTKNVTVNAMNNLLRWRDENRMLPLLLIASIVLLLAIAAAALWSHGGVAGIERFASAKLLNGAYARVEAGRTTQTQLAELGFDPTRLQAKSLSGLGVQEYFMPRTSAEYDRLDPAIRACFDAPDRCTALVFPLGPAIEKGGFMAAYATPQEPGRIVFLLRSGRVAFKAMSA
jgi:hypothetical protein